MYAGWTIFCNGTALCRSTCRGKHGCWVDVSCSHRLATLTLAEHSPGKATAFAEKHRSACMLGAGVALRLGLSFVKDYPAPSRFRNQVSPVLFGFAAVMLL